jgi:hypothetical protein
LTGRPSPVRNAHRSGNPPGRWVFFCYLAALALCASTCPPLQAQSDPSATILGSVRDAGSGAPFSGVFVVLLDESGQRLNAVLTDEEGRFVIRAPLELPVRIRAERIGLATTSSETFELSAGQVRVVDLEAEPLAVSLLGVEVTASERGCDIRDGDRVGTVRLWEEARKALEVAQWADDVGYRYELLGYRRVLDADGEVLSESLSEPEARVGLAPFATLDPDSLAERGYVHRDSIGWSFYAPDAQVLLSDTFLDTHCFSAVREDGAVGLSFEPAPDRTLPDISGTLWFDELGQLDRVAFRFANLLPELRRVRGADRAGGEVRFTLLVGGAWIVRDWSVRTPRLVARSERAREAENWRLDGFDEVGGEVLSAAVLTGASQFLEKSRGALWGRAVDGATGEGLGGAEVFLSGTTWTARTGADGSFLLQDVPPDVHVAVVEHPVLKLLGVPATSVPVEIRPDEIAVLTAELPSVDDAIRRLCAPATPGDAPGDAPGPGSAGGAVIVAGSVEVGGNGRTGDGGEVADGGRAVRLRWRSVAPGPDGGGAPSLDWWDVRVVRTDARGIWVACDVPGDREVEVSFARTTAPGAGRGDRGQGWGAARSLGPLRGGEVVWVERMPGT